MCNQVIFKGNRIYQHNICRINYTTYDFRREMETINPKSDHRDIMLLAHADGSSTHPFCYARVLGIYHANVIYTGPGARDYLLRHIEFLWVRWFELMDGPAGYNQCLCQYSTLVSHTILMVLMFQHRNHHSGSTSEIFPCPSRLGNTRNTGTLRSTVTS
jgi:hypothetical protein